MKNNIASEILVGIVLLILLILLINPFALFMPSRMTMMLLAAITILLLTLVSFFWKETARDEREDLHRLLASRASFLVGITVLLSGIIIQTLWYNLDPWLVVALRTMTLTKLLAHVYNAS